MDQIHKRFSAEQIKVLFDGYGQGRLVRASLEEILGIGKTRFFTLLKAYRQDPQGFSLTYHRTTPPWLSAVVEAEIARRLQEERNLVGDPSPEFGEV